jgi:hypothetical protein
MLPEYARLREEDIAYALKSELLKLNKRIDRTFACARVVYELTKQVPSAAVVRHFTKSGSVTSIQEDLVAFRAQLTEEAKPALNIEQFPLPLRDMFESMAVKLWALARQEAKRELDKDFADLQSMQFALDDQYEKNAAIEAERDELLAQLKKLKSEKKMPKRGQAKR